jgi:transcriptional regulator
VAKNGAPGIRPKPAKRVTPSRIVSKEKQRRVLELRLAGATYQQIADQLGYADHTGARAAAIAAMGDIIVEPASEVRTLQYERLNAMFLRLWPRVQAGDDTAMAMALRVMDKMDRLMGTEEPQKHEIKHAHEGAVLVIDGNQEEYIKRLQAMAESQGLGVNTTAGELNPGNAVPTDVDTEIVDAEVVEVRGPMPATMHGGEGVGTAPSTASKPTSWAVDSDPADAEDK